HADAGPASDHEVAELVDQDQDADDDDERDDCGQHCDYPPERPSIHAWTRVRVSASTATHSSIDVSAPPRCCASALSMSSAISVNRIRRSRKLAAAALVARFQPGGREPALLERGAREPQARELVGIG